MFSEIRRSERITEASATKQKIDRLYQELFDCRIGSDEWRRIRSEIDKLEEPKIDVFDPDARI